MRNDPAVVGPRRQWGGDRRNPMSALPPTISDGRIALARVAVMVTLGGWLAYFGTWLSKAFISPHENTTRSKVEAVVYLLIVTLLTASAMAYLVCRLGYFYRSRDHRRVPLAALDQFYARSAPALTVVVPSYKEDARVVRNTLLSAALQGYPNLRVVLLVDDPPNPTSNRERASLAEARDLPRQIQALLAGPRAQAAAALGDFLALDAETYVVTVADMRILAGHYDRAVGWLHGLARDTELIDHTDRFFADHVVLALAADLSVTAGALRSAAQEGVALPSERLAELYRRLDRAFGAELSSFERKRYVSLSHEANKAMNLNSYLGLMGGSYRERETVGGLALVPAGADDCDLTIPDADYILTLDADSILLPEYCLRLVHLMEQDQHARIGVAQTPYCAYPGAATRLERIAGASTDLQHLIHQGLTHYSATFWVGANAVLRKRALDDIKVTSYLGDWEIHRYVQDNTVIEDTESTIELRTHGWQLVNYPERLSYSATPPDFGSLCIQRRRWANGGMLILPKLRRQRRALRGTAQPVTKGEYALRLNYMASICWSSLSLVLLLAYPFRNELVSPFLGLVALPYFLAITADLKFCGYKRLDVLRIYGFNLVLLPVNLAGVLGSMLQAITGDKTPFGRTPKVRDRTIPPFSFVLTPYLVVALAAYTVVHDIHGERWNNLVYAAINAFLASYAILAFIGIRYSLFDAWVHIRAHLYKPVKRPAVAHPSPASILADPSVADWAAVLHFGGSVATQGARPTGPALPVRTIAIPGPRRAEGVLALPYAP
jgi:cellulose synthase/poly-beta-1,6-N-acetylglucosamine synthase-like glycosyltransferase